MLTRQIFALQLVIISLASCKKEEPQICDGTYQAATVTHGRNMCNQNGFVLQLTDGATYPPDNLPTAFQQAGLKVCLTYTVYEDRSYCACCGGTRLTIQDIRTR